MSGFGHFDYDESVGIGSFTFAVPVSGAVIIESFDYVVRSSLFQGEPLMIAHGPMRRKVRAQLTDMILAITAPEGADFDVRDQYQGIESFYSYCKGAPRSHVLCAFCYEIAIKAQGARAGGGRYSHVTL